MADDSQPYPAQPTGYCTDTPLPQQPVPLEKTPFRVYQSDLRWVTERTQDLYRLVLGRGICGNERYAGTGTGNRRRKHSSLKPDRRVVDRRRDRKTHYPRKLPDRPELGDRKAKPVLQPLGE